MQQRACHLQYYDYGVELVRACGLSNARLDESTSQLGADFVARNPNLLPSTRNCALRTLRHALNLAHEWGLLERPVKIRLVKGERRRDRVVSEPEFAAYIEICRQPMRDIALLTRYQGLRPWSEAVCLRWESILFTDRDGWFLVTKGKTKAARRQLPMTPEVFAALKTRHLDQGEPEMGWVFPAKTKSGHTQQGSGKNHHAKALHALSIATEEYKSRKDSVDWVRAVAEKAKLDMDFICRHDHIIQKGIPWFEPYCLRHTALTRLSEDCNNPYTLACIAGHSSTAMMERYCHPQAEEIERAFKKSSARHNAGHSPAPERTADAKEKVVNDKDSRS